MARTEAKDFEQIKDVRIPKFFFRCILAQGDILLSIVARLTDVIRLMALCDVIFIGFKSRIIIALCGFHGLGILNNNFLERRNRDDLRINSGLIDFRSTNLAGRLGSFGLRTSLLH